MATTVERLTVEATGDVTARNSVAPTATANVTTNATSAAGEETLSAVLLTPVPVKESAEYPWQSAKPETGNLAVLPSLALIAFIIAVCLRSCTWCKEDRRARRDASGTEDLGFEILTAGDRGFLEVDIRSDTTSMYDTVSSYASFLRRNSNVYYDSVNSIRGLGRHRDDSITSYRSLLLQQLDGKRDSVSSYRAFLQKIRECRSEGVQVELISDGADAYAPKKKSPHTRPSLSNGAAPRASAATACSNGAKPRTFPSSASTEPLLPETSQCPDLVSPIDIPSPSQEDKSVPASTAEKLVSSQRREHRFKVSFVPDEQLNRGRSKPVVPSSTFVDVVVRPPSPDFRVTGAETPVVRTSRRTRHNSLSAPLPTYSVEEAAAGAEWQRGGSERRKTKKRPQSISPSKEAMLMQRRSALPEGETEVGTRNAEGTNLPSPSVKASPRPGSPERKLGRARSVDRK